MADSSITTYRAGSFTSEAHPPWWQAADRIADECRNWDAALHQVLGDTIARLVIGDDEWLFGELRVYRTPDGGRYVELFEGEDSFAEVWIPDPADWLAFNASFVEPFLLTRATLYQAGRINRLGDALRDCERLLPALAA